MNKSKVKCLSFHELLNIVSFEEVFEYMKGTYHCRGEVDKYRAIFEGYKRLQPIPSDREIKTLFNSSEESEHRKKTPWTEAYMRSKSSEYTPLNWYTFSEDISGMTPDEVLGLKVMDDGEDSYAYLVGTMLWELNRDLHLTSGNADESVVGVFDKGFMTSDQYEVIKKEPFHLTQEMIDNLPVFDEEECNPEQLAEETIAIVEQAIREINGE